VEDVVGLWYWNRKIKQNFFLLKCEQEENEEEGGLDDFYFEIIHLNLVPKGVFVATMKYTGQGFQSSFVWKVPHLRDKPQRCILPKGIMDTLPKGLDNRQTMKIICSIQPMLLPPSPFSLPKSLSSSCSSQSSTTMCQSSISASKLEGSGGGGGGHGGEGPGGEGPGRYGEESSMVDVQQ